MFTATSSAISLHSINVSLHLVRLGSIKTCYWPGPDCRPVSGGLRRHSAGEDRSAVPNRTMPNFGARHSPPGTIVLFENSLRGSEVCFSGNSPFKTTYATEEKTTDPGC